MSYLVFVIFFFQAEDGIRDHCVTGVQTCALPISSLLFRPVPVACPSCGFVGMEEKQTKAAGATRKCLKCGHEVTLEEVTPAESRSEERRVGKECRSRVAAEHVKQKVIGSVQCASC